MRLERRSKWLAVAVLSTSAWAQTPTTRVSVGSGGTQSNSYSAYPSISADGRYVVFYSYADNLVASDTNFVVDVFRHDRQTGVTERASVDSGGVQGNSDSYAASISADGRYVAFVSYAPNLVANDTNSLPDIFRHDFQTGVTERASVDSAGAEADGDSYSPAISADGRYVAFVSAAANLVANDDNNTLDIFRHDFQTGVTERASVDSAGVEANSYCDSPSISDDGRYVSFYGHASNLVPNDTNFAHDVFRHDFQTGVTDRASVDSAGVEANADCYTSDVSADGRYVTFYGYATNLVPNDTNFVPDVFRHDFQTGATDRASVSSDGTQANGDCYAPSISADGRFVAFNGYASNLVANDTNFTYDVFQHDFQTGVTERRSIRPDTSSANAGSYSPSFSADGRYVAFSSSASNLVSGDTNGTDDVFVHDSEAFAIVPICFGDGTESACPCQPGAPGRGCENSGSTGGALLAATGEAFLSSDTVQLLASDERPTSLTVFWQGNRVPQRVFGDGLGCIGGQLRRMYIRDAVGGAVLAPQGADPSISARSAAMGSPLFPGAVRIYQAFYRDGNPGYCPAPFGSTFNTTNGMLVLWKP